MPATPQSFAPGSRRLRYLGLEPLVQQDFSAGAFPQNEDIPPNGAEDIVNGLIDDDGTIFRRGGSVVKTTTDTDTNILGLWDGYLLAGRRTLLHTASTVYMLNADDAGISQLAGSVSLAPGRWTQVANLLVRPLAPPNPLRLLIVGGAYPAALISAGTASATPGSATITGTGTNWHLNAQPGDVFSFTATGRPVAVKDVPSDTTLTLADPWPYAAVSGGAYNVGPALTYDSPDVHVGNVSYQSRVTQMYDRLVLGNSNRVSFTHANTVSSSGLNVPVPTLDFIQTTDYHLLPEGVIVTGLEPLRDTLLVFTTAGVWGITGLAYDIVDSNGNPQQHLQPINRDLVLWGETGLASYGGASIVPAINDVFLFDGVSAPHPFTGGARRLYRSYVKAGYQPGQAVVHRSHYLLPILDASNNWVDLMVWRLDLPGAPFTRWGGHGAQGKAFWVRSGDTTRQPTLLGAVGKRLESYAGVFDAPVTSKNDSDGTTHELEVTTRTFSLGDTVPRQWRKLRVRYELDDAATDNPTVSMEYATGRPGNAFTALSGTGTEGEQTITWPISKRVRAIRFRLRSQGPSSLERLRQLEVFFRPSGRR